MIDILMATYNGERYIRQQIMSLQSQTYSDWRLVVHDDGSKDKTVEIVRSLAEYDNRIVVLDDGIKCGSPASNFLHLVHNSTSEYAMFCDQDDIWFDNKVVSMYNAIKVMDNTMPTVVYADAYVWYPEEGIDGLANGYVAKNLKQFLFQNSGIQGCSTIFNRAMAQQMSKYNGRCAMHDHLLQFIGCAFGNVGYLPIPLILYRQHRSNFTGGEAFSASLMDRLIKHSSIPVMTRAHLNSNIDMIQTYENLLSDADKQLCKEYLSLPEKSKISKILTVLKCQFTLGGKRYPLLAKLVLRKYTI